MVIVCAAIYLFMYHSPTATAMQCSIHSLGLSSKNCNCTLCSVAVGFLFAAAGRTIGMMAEGVHFLLVILI